MTSAQSTALHILWATSGQFTRPQFVAAWSDGLVEAFPECYWRKRREAMEWFAGFGDEDDGPWKFWVTVEYVTRPAEFDGEPLEVSA